MRIITRCPEAAVLERNGSTWVVFGLVDRGALDGVGGSFGGAVDHLRSRAGEFNLLRVRNDGTPLVDAYRDVTSSYEVFTTTASDGEAVVTDTFRDAIACLDVDDRTVAEPALTDHYLFRTTVGTNTYVEEIDRLGHGERLQWDPVTDREIRTQFRRLSVDPAIDSKPEALAAIHSTLEAVYDGVTDRSNAPFVTMLSGGVDSTLLQTYSPTAESMSVDVTAPEFRGEVAYAERASDLTGSDHALVDLDESSFLEALEETIEVLGMPPHHLQKVFWDAAYRAGGWRTYANGQFADGWFGLNEATTAAVADLAPWAFASPVADVGSRILPDRYASYAESVSEAARKLRRPLSHPFGLANSFTVRGDPAVARSVVPDRWVKRRLNDRFRYVNRVVDLPIGGETTALGAHLEFGHVIDYYMDDVVTLGRQLAHGRNVTLFTPFTDRRIGEVALSIPSPGRYLDGFTRKHHLKALLGRRVPGYDTSKRKRGGGLPTERWMANGPLSVGFERYGLPDHLPEGVYSDLLENPRMDSWNALCLKIWEDRVLSDPGLTIGTAAGRIRV